jgi:hypothetical protein
MSEESFAWLKSLKTEVPIFLRNLQGKERPGFYHYSLSGDYFGERIKWGLGNAVFFLKIIYTLGLEQEFSKQVIDALVYCKTFQKKNGEFDDAVVRYTSFPFRFLRMLKKKSWQDLSYQPILRAQTRQTLSALYLFDQKPTSTYKKILTSHEAIINFLEQLNWRQPWDAGSHFSHILFFLQYSTLENKAELIAAAIAWVEKLQQQSDGCWYQGETSLQQKINGAMKIITGLKVVDRIQFKYADKLIDTCLSARNDAQACDNFNIVYVLKYASELVKNSYRFEEIKQFMVDRLAIYRAYYHQDHGGFSFYKNLANRFYYNALLTRGKSEPDIHGTVLFLWGISLILQVVEPQNDLGFKEFIT